MNYKKLIIIAIIIIFAGIALFSMKRALTPYVPFDEAMRSGEFVQVIGTLDKTRPVEHHEGYYAFFLKDEGSGAMRVRHQGITPYNFEHAEKIVALGSYDRAAGAFVAEQVLVNCPSRYTKQRSAR